VAGFVIIRLEDAELAFADFAQQKFFRVKNSQALLKTGTPTRQRSTSMLCGSASTICGFLW
jgi:hypothetical protein